MAILKSFSYICHAIFLIYIIIWHNYKRMMKEHLIKLNLVEI